MATGPELTQFQSQQFDVRSNLLDVESISFARHSIAFDFQGIALAST